MSGDILGNDEDRIGVPFARGHHRLKCLELTTFSDDSSANQLANDHLYCVFQQAEGYP